MFNETGSDYSNAELWGYAAEYVEMGDTTSEWWGDWAPETHSPFWGEDGDDDDGGDGDEQQNPPSGTPGFETIAAIAAIGIALIILRRRK